MSTSPQVINAFTSQPNQSGRVVLNIDGTTKTYLYLLHFNEVAGYWVLSLYNLQGTLILDSTPLITGNTPAGNLFRQFAYLGIGSLFIIDQSGVATPDYPNNTDLGVDFVPLWDNTPSE